MAFVIANHCTTQSWNMFLVINQTGLHNNYLPLKSLKSEILLACDCSLVEKTGFTLKASFTFLPVYIEYHFLRNWVHVIIVKQQQIKRLTSYWSNYLLLFLGKIPGWSKFRIFSKYAKFQLFVYSKRSILIYHTFCKIEKQFRDNEQFRKINQWQNALNEDLNILFSI